MQCAYFFVVICLIRVQASALFHLNKYPLYVDGMHSPT
jgi:hypothetical protein